jgi:sodium-dependent phosphate cotransporter
MIAKFFRTCVNVIIILGLLYFFLVSIQLMGHAFSGFGKDFAEKLINTTSNPFVALFIGILATSIIQSSSTTTSIVVGMVASGTLTVGCAVPIIMGANIGTSVTNTLVSFAHVTRKEEFKRAFGAALIHDIFNLGCVAVLFPLEITTHFLEKMATVLSNSFTSSQAFSFVNPLKIILKPAIKFLDSVFFDFFKMPTVIGYTSQLILAFIILFVALLLLVKVMRKLVISQTEVVFNKVLGKGSLLGIVIGAIFTALVQSSSVTTSLLIPLAGAGIITLEQVMPVTLGANIGTTVTAILASLSGGPAGVTIAFVHLLFNCVGILIIYPIKKLRNLCLGGARLLAKVSSESKRYAFLYVLAVFFIIPISLIFLSKLFLR